MDNTPTLSDDPDWWSLIDRKAALREQFPNADVLRATERSALGVLHKPLTEAEKVARGAMTQERDAELFIARMEERTGIGTAYRKRLTELATARAVKRREEWLARMRDRGLIHEEETA
jgi:hypothetical protein